MTFNEVLSQTITMLHEHGRVSYRALMRQVALGDRKVVANDRALDGSSTGTVALTWKVEEGGRKVLPLLQFF